MAGGEGHQGIPSMTRVSVVTTAFNAVRTISDTIRSVAGQTYPVEHIVIDGASPDGTAALVRAQHPAVRLVSEPDRGIFDGMNKGLRLATGEIVGLLNADDFYAGPHVIASVVARLQATGADALFADLVYVRPGNLTKVVRYFPGEGFLPERFAWGWMVPHPTLFLRRRVYERYGLFKTDYRIAGDYELAVRFLAKHRVTYTYLPQVIVYMRTGGASTRGLRSTWILNREIVRACAENGISTNLLKVYSRYLRKVCQLVRRPS